MTMAASRAPKEEAATVRLMFERYLALGSLPALQQELRQAGPSRIFQRSLQLRRLAGLARARVLPRECFADEVFRTHIDEMCSRVRKEHSANGTSAQHAQRSARTRSEHFCQSGGGSIARLQGREGRGGS